MASIPFDQLDKRIRAMERELHRGLAKGTTRGFKTALKLVVTKYIVRGGGPPNPPGGRLKWRRGNLGRSVAVFPSRVEGSNIVIGGLQAGGGNVAYARIHEEGPRARPFLFPALVEATPLILKEATKEVLRVMRKFFG